MIKIFLTSIYLLISSIGFSQWIWQSQNSGTTTNLFSIRFADVNTGWVVGYGGTILKTTNGGSEWINQVSGTTNILNSVFPIDNNLVWAVGNSSIILKTTNGGINWISYYAIPPQPDILESVYFVNNNTGWIVSSGAGVIRKTTNGGVNWNSQSIGLRLFSIYFLNDYTGWVGGENGTLLKTTDGGTTWISQNIGTTNILFSVQFANINTGWIASGTIFKTTNGGINWINLQQQSLYHLSFLDENTGWAVGFNPVQKTTNGGDSWITESSQTISTGNSIHFIGKNGWIAGYQKILHNNGFEAPNDVGVINIETPKRDTILYTGCITGSVISPKVTIKNFGTNNQNVPFNVECQIIYYSDTVYTDFRMDTISSYESHSLKFKPFVTPPDTGVYKIFVKTMLTGDTVYYNDTFYSSMKILNAHYGIEPIRGDAYSIRYRFSNSTTEASCGSYSQPIFHWEDTTGSINLIANGIPVVPLSSGNIDDGEFYLAGLLNNFSFYYGLDWDVRVFTDGYLRLHRQYVYGDISPFKSDLDFGDVDVIGRNLKYKTTPDKIIFTYDRVPVKNNSNDSEDYLTFQLILNISGYDQNVIVFQYDKASTGSTFLRKYFNDDIIPYQVGIYFSAQGVFQFGIDYRYKNYYGVFSNFGPIFENDSIAVAFGPDENVLPVELTSFTSSVSENDVNLLWAVNSQINNSGFDIERLRINNQTSDEWLKVGNVAGNGSTTNAQQYSFSDKNLSTGKYKYRLKQIDFNGSFKYYELQNEVAIGIPLKFELSQNYPNPFNPVTKIDFDIATDSKVTLKIYDAIGKEVKTLANEFKTAGFYSAEFSGSSFASGVYFYKLEANGFIVTKRMMLLK